jgi:hypothetical protein
VTGMPPPTKDVNISDLLIDIDMLSEQEGVSIDYDIHTPVVEQCKPKSRKIIITSHNLDGTIETYTMEKYV